MTENLGFKSMKKFLIIWCGQFFSMLGSGISSFGLAIWVLERTKSNMGFAITFLVQILPRLLFAPMAGSFADRKNRKKIMIATDVFDGVLKIVLFVLLFTDRMQVWTVYPIIFLSSTASIFQGPAFDASVPQIVPKEQLGRANGLRQLTPAIQNIVAPIAAGALYPMIGFSGLLIIDFVTFFAAIFTVAFQMIPQPEVADGGKKPSVMEDLKFSMAVIRKKKGLLPMIMSLALLNFLATMAMVLLGPVIMANYDPRIYGFLNSVSGVSMIVGGMIAGLFPISKNRVRTVFLSLVISALGLILMGKSPLWYVIAAGFFLFMLPVPFANGTFGTLMHLKIEGEALGRVGSLVGAMVMAVTPIASILGGVLSDHVFNPMLEANGILANTWVGAVFGVGVQRGSGLMFALSGILLTIVCIAMLSNKKVMEFETVNPDVI